MFSSGDAALRAAFRFVTLTLDQAGFDGVWRMTEFEAAFYALAHVRTEVESQLRQLHFGEKESRCTCTGPCFSRTQGSPDLCWEFFLFQSCADCSWYGTCVPHTPVLSVRPAMRKDTLQYPHT